MSKLETEDRGALGYFLPEDSQFRLRKLQQYIEFLSRLAEPRMTDEEDGPEIDAPALAGCLELLAEQVQQVLDTVSWPARLEAKGKPMAAADAAEETGEASEVEEEEEIEEADEAETVAAAGSAAAVDEDYDFGMTLDQLDEINRLLALLGAQGDLLMAGGDGDFADGTITVIGSAIFDGADGVHDIIRQVGSQVLGEVVGARVRETPAAYGNTGGATRMH